MQYPIVEFNRSATDFEWKFEITALIRHAASGKAYLINSDLFSKPVWFPVSQTQIDDAGSGPIFLYATDWIMNAKFDEGDLDRTEFYNHVKAYDQEKSGPVFTSDCDDTNTVHKRQLVCPSCGAVNDYDKFEDPTVDKLPGHYFDGETGKATKGYQQPDHNPDAPVDPDSDIPF